MSWKDFPFPNERQWVTAGLFAFALVMLLFAREDPSLWKVDTFKSVLQAVVITGLLNMVGAFHFAANKGDEAKSENTGKAFDAIAAAANSTPGAKPPDVILAPGETAQASGEEGDINVRPPN